MNSFAVELRALIEKWLGQGETIDRGIIYMTPCHSTDSVPCK